MKQYSTVILSGGLSKRMGQNKALLKYHGLPFYQYIYQHCLDGQAVYLSVGKEDHYDSSIGIHLKDEFIDCGPLSGIYQALKTMDNDYLFVVGCDMPLIDTNLAQKLLSQMDDSSDAIIPCEVGGKRHAIGGIYHKRILPILHQQLLQQDYKMMNLLTKINCQYYTVNETEQAQLMNVNNEESYHKLLARDIPIISFAGYANSGKTTLIMQVVDLLSPKYQITYLKHTHHQATLANKDSEKIYASGANQTILVGEDEILWHKKGKTNLQQIINEIKDVDLIIIEGYKNEQYPKLWVCSDEDDVAILNQREDIIGFIGEKIKTEKLVFSNQQVNEIAHYLEGKINEGNY